ncbi:TPA: CC0125/CC1285 family lipoprotein [Vibrio diabolicus]
MSIKNFLAGATVLLSLGGCATAYQNQGFTGGYSETQLDENVFVVNFEGNGYTSKKRASAFTMLRSAELTVNNGYEFFAIIDNDRYTTNSTYTTPATSHTTANASSLGNFATGTVTTTFSGSQTYAISKPSSTNTVVMFKERPANVFTYNAKFIVKSLKAEYSIE